MARNEQHLLALILVGMGALPGAEQDAADRAEPKGDAMIGGTLQLGGMVVSVVGSGAEGEDEDDPEHAGLPDVSEGRPFMVATQPRLARPTPRGDWVTPAHLDLDGLSSARRAVLARYYLALAAAEHASVASFHRAALELLHHGAPPELLLDTQGAATDEIRHARIAYGIAQRLSGRPQGPGPLDVAGSLSVDLSPEGVLARLVDDACVGETVGALRLREAGDGAVDPVLQVLLCRIAQDEERHAALGWRTLRWLLGRYPALLPVARARIHAAFEAPALPAWEDGLDLSDWGRLGPAALADTRDRAFLHIILPAATALG